MNELLDLLQNVSGCFGVNCIVCHLPLDRPESLDHGFRARWFAENPYESMEAFLRDLETGFLYDTEDLFGIHYLFASLESGILIVGPYLGEVEKDFFDTGDLTVPQADRVLNYRNSVPVVKEPEVLRNVVLRFLAEMEGNIEIRHKSMEERKEERTLLVDMVSEDQSYMDEVEERYRLEDNLMDFIREGNYTKAMEGGFQGYPVKKEYNSNLQNSKNTMFTFNTLCRKAVEQAAVHPAHIDRTSRKFADEINHCTRVSELWPIYGKMIRQYCFLVRSYSLKGYSERIQDIINFIDFNLDGGLTLEQLADQAGVSKKALSAQFRRETGQTLTEYINEKRIAKARQYLSVTELPIQEIAEKVGILDVNYFSRLFRKLEDMSPSEYRKKFGDIL